MNIAHHATILRVDSVQSFDLQYDEHPIDFQDIFIDKFGIDDARELVRKAHNRPVDANEQLLVIRTDFITLEAQNALLKVLEEPPQSTKFIFVVPRSFTVLPTLASRFNEELIAEEPVSLDENIPFSTFLKEEYKDRLMSIEQAIKKKDTEWQRLIKQGLVQYIKESEGIGASFKELEYSTRLLLTRGASNKMLFEHMALTLPTRLG